MYSIKLLNKISPTGLEALDNSRFRCVEDVENPDAVIVRSASMHDMDIPSSVLAIARAGAGTNNIPIEKCSQQGVVVFNTPGGNANAVKELTLAGLLLSARKVFPAMEWVQTLKGKGAEVPKLVEKEKSRFTGPELKGKTLGVIGMGAIGILVCNAAAQLGMEIYGYDPFISVDQAWKVSRGVKHAKSLNEIYKNCDFISLHLPATPETRGLINSQSIAQMKRHVRIINFSRGELVDDADMIAALEEKDVYCYVTDFPSDEMLGHPGVIALPHLGASTPESEENCAVMAAEQLRDFLQTGNIRNSVNLPNVQADPSTRHRVTVIHVNKPSLLTQITGAVGKNINNMVSNSRGEYAYTLLDIDDEISSDVVDKLNSIDGTIRVTVIN